MYPSTSEVPSKKVVDYNYLNIMLVSIYLLNSLLNVILYSITITPKEILDEIVKS
jgi:hypothetical protein